MTALAIKTANSFGLTNIAEWLKNIDAKLRKARLAKQTIKELSRLSDRELNDMGIARGEIYSIAHGISDTRRDAETNKNLRGWV
jgi:uncharacterized protein YjiS (DUF1127 family)